MADTLPIDEDQRRLVRERRDLTLFVEAGAGSGKTRALVDRIEALVLDDGVAMDAIAAITFTEKAAAELRDRIRQRFEDRIAVGDLFATPAREAVQQLDGAAVGTLHAFAQRILGEHPVEAGLPPGVEVLDEIGSQVEFELRWREFLDDLLDDDTVGRSLLILEAGGVRLDALRTVALQMAANWDLIEDRLLLDPPQPPPFDVDGLVARFDEVLALRERGIADADDALLPYFNDLEQNRADLLGALDEIDALSLVADMGEAPKARRTLKPGNKGKAANWTIDVGDVRKAIRGLGVVCDQATTSVTTSALHHIGARIGRFVLVAAEDRRASGRLEFHDLLVRARRLLRDSVHGAAVRASLRDRYQRLLLDEFQDTDPIQIELAVLIAAADDGTSVADRPWDEIDVAAGRLFLVGDPKQSIYRFRRADIGVYLAARDRVEDRADLTVNFRTTAPVIDFINDVFSALIQAEPGSQPAYAALSAHRGDAAPDGPSVALLGADPIPERLDAEQLRAVEARAVALTVAEAVRGDTPWSVEDGEGGWRPARPSDVCILLPARTSLSALERALDNVAMPYRAETSSLVYASREVRELMLALRAVADPTDELATVAALRSFVYGCGDDDLAHWRLGLGGRFSLRSELPTAAGNHPVADALRHLAELHEQRLWSTPAELLDRLIRERAVLESAIATGAPRDVWRRLRFVLDQARAWVDAGGTDLRAYLEWARLQGADNARISETVLPETDDDSVRIMTIHGAKGLEFPITVLSGMTTRFQNPSRGPAVVFPPTGQVLLKISSRIASEGYDAWQPIDDQMDEHERLRLLYVAATRARDHLVVSLHREDRRVRTSASVLAEPALARAGAAAYEPTQSATMSSLVPTRAPLPDRATWAAERQRAFEAASTRRVVAATTLAAEAAVAPDPGLDKRSRDLDLPPWQKGRYGTAVGRAVHGVLQVVDLATGEGLADAAAAQSAAEGVAGQEAVVTRLAQAGLTTHAAAAATAGQHWRELWVAAPVGDRLVEGYIDLLYRTPEGLVVVDWKTDQVGSPDEVDAKVSRYRLQGASYAAALAAATGEPVARMTFVFLREDGATEVDLPDLPAAMDEVVRRAADLAELSAVDGLGGDADHS